MGFWGTGGAEHRVTPRFLPPSSLRRLRAPAAHPRGGGGFWGHGPAGARCHQLSHLPGPAVPGEGGGAGAFPPIPTHPHPSLTPVSPPQNGGVCQDAESGTYVCRCPHGFTGSNCEYSRALHCHPGKVAVSRGDVTPVSLPGWVLMACHPTEACGPDATCVNRPDGQGYTCRCHLGKAGDRCTEGEPRGDTGTALAPPWGRGHGVGTTLRRWGHGWGPPWGHRPDGDRGLGTVWGDGHHRCDGDGSLGTTPGRWARWGTGDHPGEMGMGLGTTLGTWGWGWGPQQECGNRAGDHTGKMGTVGMGD